MLIVGITGGIGSGKSLICNIFKMLGVEIYNADFEAKRLMNCNTQIKSKLLDLFGNEIYTENNLQNKKMLADIIFTNPKALQSVNSIVHQVVIDDFKTWVKSRKSGNYVIKEAAILFESEAYKEVDKTVTVYAPEHLRIERCLKRDKSTETEIKQRIKNQMSDEEKVNRANFVVYNDNQQLVIPQVLKLHSIFNKK